MQASINEIATWTGLDRRTIGRRLESLTPESGPNRSRLYETRQALPLLYGQGEERLDPGQELARLNAARRRQIDMQNERTAGLLIPKDEVAAAWAENVAIAKGRLLSLPSRVSNEVLRLKTQREIENTLKDAVIAILTELSGG